MRSAAQTSRKSRSDFYKSTLAPINQRTLRFRAADAVILIVLFLELALLTRLFLAN